MNIGECSICIDTYTDAIILNCGHTFCLTCITTQCQYKLECPNCKAIITNASPNLLIRDLSNTTPGCGQSDSLNELKQLINQSLNNSDTVNVLTIIPNSAINTNITNSATNTNITNSDTNTNITNTNISTTYYTTIYTTHIIYNGTTETTYTNVRVPVHVIR